MTHARQSSARRKAGRRKATGHRAGKSPASLAPLQSLLGRAPLLRSESADAYDKLAAQCAAAIEPRDAIESLMLRDYVDLTWEIARLKRMTQHVVTVASPDAVSFIAEELSDEGGRDEAGALAAMAWSEGGVERATLTRDLERHDVAEEAIETHAFLRELDSIGAIERILGDKDRMRRSVLRDLEAYRAGGLCACPDRARAHGNDHPVSEDPVCSAVATDGDQP